MLGFAIPGDACFVAGFTVGTAEVMTGLVPTAAPAGFDTATVEDFGTAEDGGPVALTWPGISDDAVPG